MNLLNKFSQLEIAQTAGAGLRALGISPDRINVFEEDEQSSPELMTMAYSTRAQIKENLNQKPLTREQWAEFLSLQVSDVERTIAAWEFDQDGWVTIHGGCSFTFSGINTLPPGIKETTGYFNLVESDITSCENFPRIMEGDISLMNNYELRSLKGLPEEVDGDLSLYKCTALTSLEHLPKRIPGSLDIRNCESLVTFPEDIDVKVVYVHASQSILIEVLKKVGVNYECYPIQ